jgi:beta-galactosidase
MYDWIHATDPTRLVHYEPDQNATSTDMYSHMYPSLEDMAEQVANHTDKFYILCEYAHAMGNGRGGLLEYVLLFRTEPLMQGGLVWEWNNHGLKTSAVMRQLGSARATSARTASLKYLVLP